jgi:hypothetical protein
MRKISLLALLLALAVTLGLPAIAKKKVVKPKKAPAKTAVKPSMTVEQLMNKVIQAEGGRASRDKVKTMVITGVRRVTRHGISMPFEVYYKAPDKLLFVGNMSQIGNMTMGCDGNKGWSNDTIFGLRDIVGGELEMFKQQWIPCPESGWKQYKKTSITGTKKIGKTMTYIVKLFPESGNPKIQYIDMTTFLPVRTERYVMLPVGTIPVEIQHRDWRVIEGIAIPYESSVNMVTGDELAQRAASDNALTKTEIGDALTELVLGNTLIELIDVKLNVEVDDTIFEKPISPATPGVIIHPE